MKENKTFVFKIHRFLWKIKMLIFEIIREKKYANLIEYNRAWINKHEEEKCFIVCNGPSLRTDDLERIREKGFISFGCNKVFMLFKDVKWRPTYYAFCDSILYSNFKEDLDALDIDKFVPLDIYEKMENPKGRIHVFSRVPFQFFNNKPSFQPNLLKRLSEGGTITYHMMQLAVAMGFKEIYLIGVDFSFSWGIGPDGKYYENPKIKDHFAADNTKTDTMPNLFYNLQAYKSAKKYADRHGIKIFNATRGGKLEVFERVDFDTLFN